MENDPRTEEQVDADWRRVTESIFGANTGAAPKVVEWKGECDKDFVPNWGNKQLHTRLSRIEGRGEEMGR